MMRQSFYDYFQLHKTPSQQTRERLEVREQLRRGLVARTWEWLLRADKTIGP